MDPVTATDFDRRVLIWWATAKESHVLYTYTLAFFPMIKWKTNSYASERQAAKFHGDPCNFSWPLSPLWEHSPPLSRPVTSLCGLYTCSGHLVDHRMIWICSSLSQKQTRTIEKTNPFGFSAKWRWAHLHSLPTTLVKTRKERRICRHLDPEMAAQQSIFFSYGTGNLDARSHSKLPGNFLSAVEIESGVTTLTENTSWNESALAIWEPGSFCDNQVCASSERNVTKEKL